MQILGLLFVFLLEAQNGRSSRSDEHKQSVMISKADGTFSKMIGSDTVYEEHVSVAPTKADSQDAEHASNESFNTYAANKQQVIRLELDSRTVTAVMRDHTIFESTGPVIIWEGGAEKWDQGKSETAADDTHGVSRQALDYAWEKAKPLADSDFFIVATDVVPVKEEIQDMFLVNRSGTTLNIFFTETAKAVELFNRALKLGRRALVMLSLGTHAKKPHAKKPHATYQHKKKSFGRTTSYPNIAIFTFSMAMSFIFMNCQSFCLCYDL